MDKIAIIDFGGQYAHLIANRVRKLGVYSEILDSTTPAQNFKDYKGIIFSGGPASVYEKGAPTCDPEILNLNIPILGICYGHQLLAHLQGGKVMEGEIKEFGPANIKVVKPIGILKNMQTEEKVWMSHGDEVIILPEGYEIIGSTEFCAHAAVANPVKNFYGVQFHLEVLHTENGLKMLENFLDLCQCKKDWEIGDFLEKEMEAIRKQVGNKKVFMLISGGVDSTVAIVLLEKALSPENVYGLFIDTGFMRKNERTEVEKSFQELGIKNFHTIDASEKFIDSLKNITDPEAKRKVIGDVFIKVQEAALKEMDLNPEEWFLGQGTIYPDTIESGGTKHASKIKTHHNRVAKIQELIDQGKVIEPLAQLYKDEVRELGRKLNIPESLISRHPFPGPGLAVRMLCANEEKWPEQSQSLEKEINQYLAPHNTTAKILPIQSVGVQGDHRTYKNPIALITDTDFETLNVINTNLINSFKPINRGILLVHPPAINQIHLQKCALTSNRISLLQEADFVVREFIEEKNLTKDIWQFPTVLIPLAINREFGESLVLRPINSEEAMTANFYPMHKELLKELTARLTKIDGISAVFFDVTNKPPGTIEWE